VDRRLPAGVLCCVRTCRRFHPIIAHDIYPLIYDLPRQKKLTPDSKAIFREFCRWPASKAALLPVQPFSAGIRPFPRIKPASSRFTVLTASTNCFAPVQPASRQENR
jgi:hypothetical protein